MPSGRVLMHSTKFSLVRLRSSRKRDSDQIATLTALTAAHAGAGGFTRLGGAQLAHDAIALRAATLPQLLRTIGLEAGDGSR